MRAQRAEYFARCDNHTARIVGIVMIMIIRIRWRRQWMRGMWWQWMRWMWWLLLLLLLVLLLSLLLLLLGLMIGHDDWCSTLEQYLLESPSLIRSDQIK